MNATITALIEKHLNATLTAAEAATLAQAMAENPALAEEFAAATRMEADLSSAMKETERTALYTRRMERAAAETEPARARRRWPMKTMAAVAGIAALIGVGWRLMDVAPLNKPTAKKGSPASPLAGAAGGGHASLSGDTRIADASALKRKLRRFASSTSRLRGVPVSQALAVLQSEWKDYAHGNAKDKDAVFVIADSARHLWKQPEDEPAVSLEIPGISLLTSLELIAAQAGLKTAVSATGVSLEPHARKDDGKERTWSIPLSAASVTAFISGVSKQQQLNDAVRRSAGTWFYKTPYDSRSALMSWMEMPVARLAGSDLEEVKRSFNRGLGYYDLGQFNEAETEFNRILAIDPYNVAARRHLEKVRGERSLYLKASRDETRLRMLNAVDALWTIPVPGTSGRIFDPNSGQALDANAAVWGEISSASSAADGSMTFLTPLTGRDANSYEVAAGINTNVQAYESMMQNGIFGIAPDVVTRDTQKSEILVADGQAPVAETGFITESTASLADDGYTIDLNLAPEVVEFDGFINYGEPIQTTGINVDDGFINFGEYHGGAPGGVVAARESLTLTDSGITQPVFATRVLMDHPGNLSRLLAAHGVPAEGTTWDQEHGVVMARGPLSQLRAAQAAAAAVEEAATAGVIVEMKVIEWKHGIPAPVADRSGLLPPPATGGSGAISAAAVSDLLGDPGLERVGDAKATEHTGAPFRLYPVYPAKSYDRGFVASAGGISRSGYSWRGPVKIHREDETVSGIARSREEIESGWQQFDLQLQDGEWLRVDFPAPDGTKAATVLLSVQPATVQP